MIKQFNTIKKFYEITSLDNKLLIKKNASINKDITRNRIRKFSKNMAEILANNGGHHIKSEIGFRRIE